MNDTPDTERGGPPVDELIGDYLAGWCEGLGLPREMLRPYGAAEHLVASLRGAGYVVVTSGAPLHLPPLPCRLCADGRFYTDAELLPHLRGHHPEHVNPQPGPYLSTACLLGLCAAFDRCGCAQRIRGESGMPARKYDNEPCACPNCDHREATDAA